MNNERRQIGITRKVMLAGVMVPLAGLALLFAAGFTGSSAADAQASQLARLRSERIAVQRAITPSVVAVARSAPAGSDQRGAGTNATSGFVVDDDYVVSDLESLPLRDERFEMLKIGDTAWMMSHDGTEFSGTVVGVDIRTLLVVFKMDEGHPKLPSLKFADSDKAKMGSTAFSFGNSLNSMVHGRSVTMSYGTVSGFYRFEPVDPLDPDAESSHGDPYKGNILEIDCAVHPGDHGGPVVNLDGKVIGMTCGHFMTGRYVGSAVPSNQITSVLAQLKKGIEQKDLAHATIGIKLQYKAANRAQVVTGLVSGGPAEKAGIKEGWELIRVDNFPITRQDRLKEMLGFGRIKRTVSGGMFGSREIDVCYGLPVGTHMQLTFRDPKDGSERTVDLISTQKEEDF